MNYPREPLGFEIEQQIKDAVRELLAAKFEDRITQVIDLRIDAIIEAKLKQIVGQLMFERVAELLQPKKNA